MHFISKQSENKLRCENDIRWPTENKKQGKGGTRYKRDYIEKLTGYSK
jgi:hypothetical protein